MMLKFHFQTTSKRERSLGWFVSGERGGLANHISIQIYSVEKYQSTHSSIGISQGDGNQPTVQSGSIGSIQGEWYDGIE